MSRKYKLNMYKLYNNAVGKEFEPTKTITFDDEYNPFDEFVKIMKDGFNSVNDLFNKDLTDGDGVYDEYKVDIDYIADDTTIIFKDREELWKLMYNIVVAYGMAYVNLDEFKSFYNDDLSYVRATGLFSNLYNLSNVYGPEFELFDVRRLGNVE